MAFAVDPRYLSDITGILQDRGYIVKITNSI